MVVNHKYWAWIIRLEEKNTQAWEWNKGKSFSKLTPWVMQYKAWCTVNAQLPNVLLLLCHFLWLRQTHQLTIESVDYKSVMFNSERPLFRVWLRSNKTLKCKYCFIKLLKGFFLCQCNKTFLQLYQKWYFVNRKNSVNIN